MPQPDYIQADTIIRHYKLASADIHNNANLAYWSTEVAVSIAHIKESIAKAQQAGTPTTSLEEVLNGFYYLRYQIAERT